MSHIMIICDISPRRSFLFLPFSVCFPRYLVNPNLTFGEFSGVTHIWDQAQWVGINQNPIIKPNLDCWEVYWFSKIISFPQGIACRSHSGAWARTFDDSYRTLKNQVGKKWEIPGKNCFICIKYKQIQKDIIFLEITRFSHFRAGGTPGYLQPKLWRPPPPARQTSAQQARN